MTIESYVPASRFLEKSTVGRKARLTPEALDGMKDYCEIFKAFHCAVVLEEQTYHGGHASYPLEKGKEFNVFVYGVGEMTVYDEYLLISEEDIPNPQP